MRIYFKWLVTLTTCVGSKQHNCDVFISVISDIYCFCVNVVDYFNIICFNYIIGQTYDVLREVSVVLLKTFQLSHQDLHKATAGHLRELIASKQLRPGDRVPTENEMVEMFGVGRSTIREAVKLLIAENVVEIQRGRGTYVSAKPGLSEDPLGLSFTDQDKLLKNLFETRLIIEPQIAWFAAKRATTSDILYFENIMEKFYESELHPEKDPIKFSELDIEFHTQIAYCTHNEVLCRFLPSVCESIYKSLVKTSERGTTNQTHALNSHIKIFKAIKNKRPDLAKNEMESHILQTMEDAKIVLQN